MDWFIAIGGVLASFTGVGVALRVSIIRIYNDLKEDRARTQAEHREDRERWRKERAEFHAEVTASREERAACQAKLEMLEQTVRDKLIAAQPRDEHGRFEAERG